METRTLGKTSLPVSRIALGCWPMAGISSLDVTDEQSVDTIVAAQAQGINFFDTAYSYGYDGRSSHVIRRARQLLQQGSRQIDLSQFGFYVASKVGQEWNDQRERVVDGRPESLIRRAEEELDRLGVAQMDLIYLHSVDPNVPIEESADAIREICNRGWALNAGVCNVDLEQATRFNARCPVAAIQIPFNMLQQDSLRELRAFANANEITLICYWIYMKGLLAGHFERDHVFSPDDRRLSYAVYQGVAWERAQDLLDGLRQIALKGDWTVAQLVAAWALRPGRADIVLLGAKTPLQVAECASASYVDLSEEDWEIIERLVTKAVEANNSIGR